MRLLLPSILLAACAPAPESPSAPDRVAIVIAEKSSSGARLVAIDERGDRQFELIYGPEDGARETHPAISPDGKWILYTSTRGGTSQKLWLAQIGNAPRELQVTHGPSIETQAAWAPDGTSFVFATLDGTNFDLYRMGFARGRVAPQATRITHGGGHEVSPSFAPDGSIIYASAALDSYDSHLERLMPDGTIVQVTAGPNEGAPAVSPDGHWIAYACRQTTIIPEPVTPSTPINGERKPIGSIQHRDICVRPLAMPADSTETIAPVVSLPPSDEDGPVWSRDGRYLFATSAVWGENGVLFSSVIFIDMKERPRRARILLDHGGPAPRMTPAIGTSQLMSADLAQNPEYLSSLARIMTKRIQQQIREEQGSDAAGSASP
jgi:Tol biopolymer transport system component